MAIKMTLRPGMEIRKAEKKSLDHVTVWFEPDGTRLDFVRRLRDWAVDLEIQVNGVLWHRNEAGPSERALFDHMMDEAFKMQNAEIEALRTGAHTMALKVLTIDLGSLGK